ncbi:MAG: type II toxin-antitoxin system VapC family toxin [Planctomycetes bacterium]|nr:type II toxin-antitoxin system VapC family toxin [Planctomycetota bacterium]
MKYVVDSSVAFKWLVPEIDTDKALRLLDDYQNGIHELLSPDILPVETTHALTRAERQGRVTPAQGSQLFIDFMDQVPTLHSYLALLPRAYAISSAMRVGVYDCLYIALAEQEGCELVTADARMINSLQKDFPFITPLSSMP